jgi:hypothetical protein
MKMIYLTASRFEARVELIHHISCGAIHIESFQDSNNVQKDQKDGLKSIRGKEV